MSSKFGRTNVEFDAIICRVKTTAACAKEAYEFLDAVIQNDNASPTVQRPLVVNRDDGTATVYYQGHKINVASKSAVSSAVCELKKDDSRCDIAHDVTAPSYAPAPDDAQKATEEQSEKSLATETLKQLDPQYKQAITQLEQLTDQRSLAEKKVADFRQQQTQNMYAAEQAHSNYWGQQTPSTLTQQVEQQTQQETQAAQVVNQLAGQVLTQEMILKGFQPAKAITTVSDSEYKTLSVYVSTTKTQREIGVLEQTVQSVSERAVCITDLSDEPAETRMCVTINGLVTWAQSAAERALTQAFNTTTHAGTLITPPPVDGITTRPVVLYQAQPELSEEARTHNISGVVEVYFWVGTDGKPSHIQVVHGLGAGLDEKAAEAVNQYRFEPAMKDGVPVITGLYVNVDFQN